MMASLHFSMSRALMTTENLSIIYSHIRCARQPLQSEELSFICKPGVRTYDGVLALLDAQCLDDN